MHLNMAFVFMIMASLFNPFYLMISFAMFIVIMSLNLSFIIDSHLISFIILLTFMSSIMIILLYMVSVIMNEKLMINIKSLVSAIIIITVLMSNDKEYSTESHLNENYIELALFESFIKFSNNPTSLISILLMVMLLLLLMIIYEILKKFKGPMRAKM